MFSLDPFPNNVQMNACSGFYGEYVETYLLFGFMQTECYNRFHTFIMECGIRCALKCSIMTMNSNFRVNNWSERFAELVKTIGQIQYDCVFSACDFRPLSYSTSYDQISAECRNLCRDIKISERYRYKLISDACRWKYRMHARSKREKQTTSHVNYARN